MNHIIRLSISAPVRDARDLHPLTQAIMVAIHDLAKARDIEVLCDINLSASNPKTFAKNWEKRQREIAKESR